MLILTHIIYILFVRGYMSTYSLVIETPNEEKKFEIRMVWSSIKVQRFFNWGNTCLFNILNK